MDLATARIGAVMVTVNPANRSSEVAYVLKQSNASALFLVDQFKKSNYFEILADAVPELADATVGELDLAEFPQLRHVVSMKDHAAAGMSTWDEFISQGDSVEQ